MTREEIAELKAEAQKSPTVVFDHNTNYGRFYNKATPQTVLKLIQLIERYAFAANFDGIDTERKVLRADAEENKP